MASGGLLRLYRNGLLLTGPYLDVDFGSGHLQAMRGDAILGGITINTTGATSGQVLAFNMGTGRFEPTTLSSGAVSSPQAGAVVWNGQQTFNAGIYGPTGLVIGVATGQTIFFDVNGSSVVQIDANGMVSVGTVPTASAPGVVSASTGFALVDGSGGLQAALSFGSGTRMDIGSSGYQTNLKGSEVTLPSVAFASLPVSPPNGSMCFCTNVRVGSEGAGSGTGAPVVYKTSGGAGTGGAGWYVIGVFATLAVA